MLLSIILNTRHIGLIGIVLLHQLLEIRLILGVHIRKTEAMENTIVAVHTFQQKHCMKKIVNVNPRASSGRDEQLVSIGIIEICLWDI
jgi:hypothetical protein